MVGAGPCGPLCGGLPISPDIALPVFGACARSLCDSTNDFLHIVVLHRWEWLFVTGVSGFWRIHWSSLPLAQARLGASGSFP